MGSYINFKNSENGIGELPVTNPLARQSSIFTMTFDEFQHTMPVKDFGSLNMEDLLKSIWTTEEGQALVDSSNGGGTQIMTPGNLQRQGSLTLPRTLSQKTVDEVWRDAFKETVGHVGSTSLGQREPTFGETTLEEFLFRAGVVREEDTVVPNASGGMYGNNSSFVLGFQQNPVLNSPRLGISGAEIMSMNSVLTSHQQTQQPKLQPLLPKQTNTDFSSAAAAAAKRSNNDGVFINPRTKGMMTDSTEGPLGVQGKKSMAIGGLNAAVKSGIVASSPSPSPYNVGGDSGRGRRRSSASLEKVVERRRKRMIKNRESASRSRARKQAYTLELEAEIAKLKELNEGLRREQEQFEEMQKNQILEKKNTPLGNKRICCLRRTVTGPW